MFYIQTVNLSFAFPFYGTEVDTVTVTSAGAVLIGDSNFDDGVMVLPSHVAAFLTSMPREAKDTVEFTDSRCTNIRAFREVRCQSQT